MTRYILFITLLLLYGCIKQRDHSNEKIVLEKTREPIFDDKTFQDSRGLSYSLNEIENWDGVFLIISTTCGACYNYYSTANKISTSTNSFKHVALLTDPFTSLEEYKKGIVYKSFGFLNDNWIVFSSDELIKILNKDYKEEKDGYPFLFLRKKNNIIAKNSDIQKIEDINILLINKH